MRTLIALLLVLSSAGCDRDGPPPPPEARPRVVAVDWMGRGAIYAATVTGERSGLTGVRYADGEREWVEPSRVRPWPNLHGRSVSVWSRGAARPAQVVEERAGLLHVRFAEGGDSWVSLDMLYALDASAPTSTPEATPAFPARPPVQGVSVRPGDHVLAYWVSAGEVSRSRPYVCEVTSVGEEGVALRYLEDGSEATVTAAEILRVLEPVASTERGRRHWLADPAPVGTVLERRGELTKLRVGAQERWVEAPRLLEPADPFPASQLHSGARVTALWNGESLYHATVVSVAGGQVTLRWHDGSEASAVPLSDVVEVW